MGVETISQKKVDVVQAHKMFLDGNSYQVIADYFGVSKGRVAQIVKENKWKSGTRAIRNTRLGDELVETELDARRHVMWLFDQNKEIIEVFRAAAQGDDEALEALERMGSKDKMALYLKALENSMNQLSKFQDMLIKHQQAVEVEQWKNAVAEAINAEDGAIKQRIFDRIMAYKDTQKKLVG